MRRTLTALAVLTALTLAPAASEAGSGKRKGGGSSRHDVSVKLSKPKSSEGGTTFRLTVKNKTRNAESGVSVTVWSDADPVTPVWEATTDLSKRERARWNLVLDLPEGTTQLSAAVEMGGGVVDARPSDDEDVEACEPEEDHDEDVDDDGEEDVDEDEDGDDGAPAGDPPTATAATRGAEIWNSLCVGCHGADGRGGTVEEVVSDEGAGSIYEAVREGEGGMPVFSSLTRADCTDIAAYLRDPSAATPPADGGGTGGTGGQPGTGTGGTGTGTGGTGTGGTGGTGTGGTGTGTGGTTGPAPTYTNRIAAIMSKNCVACHTGTKASAKIRLDTYANVSKNATAALAAIQGGRMPPGGAVPTADVTAIQEWIKAGKPQ